MGTSQSPDLEVNLRNTIRGTSHESVREGGLSGVFVFFDVVSGSWARLSRRSRRSRGQGRPWGALRFRMVLAYGVLQLGEVRAGAGAR